MQTHNATKRTIGAAIDPERPVVVKNPEGGLESRIYGAVGPDEFVVSSHASIEGAIRECYKVRKQTATEALVAAAEATDHPADIQVGSVDSFMRAVEMIHPIHGKATKSGRKIKVDLPETEALMPGHEFVSISIEQWTEIQRLAGHAFAERAKADAARRG